MNTLTLVYFSQVAVYGTLAKPLCYRQPECQIYRQQFSIYTVYCVVSSATAFGFSHVLLQLRTTIHIMCWREMYFFPSLYWRILWPACSSKTARYEAVKDLRRTTQLVFRTGLTVCSNRKEQPDFFTGSAVSPLVICFLCSVSLKCTEPKNRNVKCFMWQVHVCLYFRCSVDFCMTIFFTFPLLQINLKSCHLLKCHIILFFFFQVLCSIYSTDFFCLIVCSLACNWESSIGYNSSVLF